MKTNDPIWRRNLEHRHSVNSQRTKLESLDRFKSSNWSCFWARCSSTATLFRTCDCVLRSFFKADTIIASSISIFHTIDRDVQNSSIDFPMSTSSFPNKVIWGSADLRQALVLKLTFQVWNSTEDSIPFYEFSDYPSYNCEMKFQHGWTFHFCFVMTYSTILFSFHSPPCSFCSTRSQFPGRMMPNFELLKTSRESFLSRWSFKNVSCNTRTILYFTR